MKAAFIKQYGDAVKLNIGQLDQPEISANQVLIKVAASGVNPVDFHIRNGMMADSGAHTLPLILGWDCSGVVAQVGAEVDGLELGDKVLSFTPIAEQGTNAEYVAVNADLVVLKPERMSFIQAAALPLASVTAWQGLHTHAGIKQGQMVLIHNASGGVGSFAVQIAKAAGAHVVATASDIKLEYVKSLGADEVYSEAQKDWHSSMRYDIAFVAKGGMDLLHRTVPCVKAGGRIVSTFDELSESDVGTNGATFTRMWVENNADDLNKVLALFNEHQLTIPIDTVYPLEDIQLAHKRSEQYKAVGKIVLTVDSKLKY
ncbi:NADP-dependent oxidoreductase [Vibrio sp. Isolate25]|uniref:NADP-dependent oxidoreductase n=1 Tax=Vibrio sp. Isolate25 TaxID=2908535 RepID=UPI001EFDC9CA|nr:NADP-dependent oxidoreductase [Vibrio sp. Isolate25]MCG9596330.1 NADP-dependent oxidoreductase [Vibrio sp. Isolate25]